MKTTKVTKLNAAIDKIFSGDSGQTTVSGSSRLPKFKDGSAQTFHPSLAVRLHEHVVKQKWKAIIGPQCDASVTSVVLRGKILYVTVQSSTVRNELLLNKSAIIMRINEEMHTLSVTDIILK